MPAMTGTPSGCPYRATLASVGAGVGLKPDLRDENMPAFAPTTCRYSPQSPEAGSKRE